MSILPATIGAALAFAAVIIWETRLERRRVSHLKGDRKWL